jgi:hypothetical protein
MDQTGVMVVLLLLILAAAAPIASEAARADFHS